MTNKYIESSMGSYLQDEFLTPLNLSQNGLAKALRVDAGRINEIINNKRKITADTDLRLCKYFSLTNGFFLRIQNRIDSMYAERKIKHELDTIIPFVNKVEKENLKSNHY